MWNQLSLQDANSPIMEHMILFYDHAMMIIIMIVVLISYMLLNMFLNKNINRYLCEGQFIEMIWTIIPMVFLIFIAIPSLKILYLTDEIIHPNLTVKCIGHQWYWSYEYNDYYTIEFDSFMLNKLDPSNDMFRLLDVDNRLKLPVHYQIRLLVTSMDVIHSFALPSMGVKVDAVPGRINQTHMYMYRVGLYFGQCSEICGVNHSFMPIVVESISEKLFYIWVINDN